MGADAESNSAKRRGSAPDAGHWPQEEAVAFATASSCGQCMPTFFIARSPRDIDAISVYGIDTLRAIWEEQILICPSW